MGKITALFLAAALALSAGDALAKRIEAPQAVRDATWRASESVMTSDISRAQSVIPLGTIVAWPHNDSFPSSVADDWAECDGRALPAGCDLRKQSGITHTPNLYTGAGAAGRGYFLRAGATSKLTSADKFESHLHGQPAHSHNVVAHLNNTKVTATLDDPKVEGRAAGQAYNDFQAVTSPDVVGQLWPGGVRWGTSIVLEAWANHWPGEHGGGGALYTRDGYIGIYDLDRQAKPSNLVNTKVVNKASTGKVVDGSVTGTAVSSGGDDTYATGADETSPTYYTTRYFMRINE